MNIRAATGDDAADITRVQVSAWQSAYTGIVPPGYLESMKTTEWQQTRTQRWQQRIVEFQNIAFVAEAQQAGITGFVIGGECRENGELPEPYDGELYSLYILPAYHGQGIGRQLMTMFTHTLANAGFRQMLLWVMKDNHPARGFYERMGGQLVTEHPFSEGGKELLEVSYGWQDLSVFQPEI